LYPVIIVISPIQVKFEYLNSNSMFYIESFLSPLSKSPDQYELCRTLRNCYYY